MNYQGSQLRTNNAKYLIFHFQIISNCGPQHLLTGLAERCHFIYIGTDSASHRLIKRAVGGRNQLWRNTELLVSTFHLPSLLKSV